MNKLHLIWPKFIISKNENNFTSKRIMIAIGYLSYNNSCIFYFEIMYRACTTYNVLYSQEFALTPSSLLIKKSFSMHHLCNQCIERTTNIIYISISVVKRHLYCQFKTNYTVTYLCIVVFFQDLLKLYFKGKNVLPEHTTLS